MKNYHKTLTSSLSEILPTYYELNMSGEIEVPCASYMELANFITDGDTLDSVGDVAEVTYQIKVWGTDIGNINTYAQLIDSTLKPEGWKRTSSQDMHDNKSSMIQRIMLYTIVDND